ncbi:hypothetical protein FNV43_RR22694 [Rhamnella rubrinervis]|uniref:Uncharacterized protein n=1 Tax=Rhamnella rubrinervis TaxID=2594499 RepID=A0A8K0DWM2_9ROSA|nr:hypothetical protein FNV43_RR22694 [Rhamnella rubrinervis]
MKSGLAFLCILLSVLLFANLSYGRKNKGDYWKSIMKDQPMPEAIRDLFHVQDEPSLSSAGSAKTDRFARNFDVRPNVIIYHAHLKPEEGKSVDKGI